MKMFSKTLLLALALALVALVSSDVAIKVTADGDGSLTPQDCKQLQIATGPCDRKKCFNDCRANIGLSAVGECVPGGCQCTYCFPSLRN